MRVGVIGGPGQETNPLLVGAWCAAGIDALPVSLLAARRRRYLDTAAALHLPPGDQTEMSATSAPESVSRSLVRILTD